VNNNSRTNIEVDGAGEASHDITYTADAIVAVGGGHKTPPAKSAENAVKQMKELVVGSSQFFIESQQL